MAGNRQAHRVLVVREDGPQRRALVEAMREEGMEAWGASSIAFARSMARRRKPELVVLALEAAQSRRLVAQLRQDGNKAVVWSLVAGSELIYVPAPTPLSVALRAAREFQSGLAALAPPPEQEPASRVSRPPRKEARVVLIGISTGGPKALAVMLPKLPANFPLPVVIVQHMPAQFTGMLAERLDAQCALNVREGFDGAVLEPGNAWIAPGGMHTVLQRRLHQVVLRLNSDPPENGCRPAVDPLFRSGVEVYGGRVLGVVMTGMGRDGAAGAVPLAAAGARLLAQDKLSSVVWGMPGALVAAGLADEVVPLDQLAAAIVRVCPAGVR